MPRTSSRRDFLKQSALAGTGFWVAGGLTGASARQPGPNERVNVAGIGVGGRGGADVTAVVNTNLANMVALCDVDESFAGTMFGRHPRATKYSDFRVMLDKQRDIDAIIVGTPDHTHAQIAVTAMRMGKHAYVEKPLCHNIWECRLMRDTARQHRVVTQMGNQGTANNTFRRGVEVVRAGTIGNVREVHIWTNRPIWPQNLDRPMGSDPVPKTLKWDLWLGPAPARPYVGTRNNVRTYHPFNWRGWWDFGTGALGDMACHTMNLPFMALRLGYPSAVSAVLTTPLKPETGPEGCKITYEFPARGNLPPVTVYWYERSRPPQELVMGQTMRQSGSVMVGSQGSLFSSDDYGQQWTLLPQERFRHLQDPAPSLPRSPGHHREWIDAIRGGPPTMSSFSDYATLLAETVLLGDVAIRAGARVVWDAEKMEAVGLPSAARFIKRERRKGWEL